MADILYSDGSYIVKTRDKIYLADTKWMEISLRSIYDQMRTANTLPEGVEKLSDTMFLEKAGSLWHIGEFERSFLTTARYESGKVIPVYTAVDHIELSKILYAHFHRWGEYIISVVMEDENFACFRFDEWQEFFERKDDITDKLSEQYIADNEWVFKPEVISSYEIDGINCTLHFKNLYKLKVKENVTSVSELLTALVKRAMQPIQLAPVQIFRDERELWQIAMVFEWEDDGTTPKRYKIVSPYNESWEEKELAALAAELRMRKERGEEPIGIKRYILQLQEYFLDKDGQTAAVAASDAEVLIRRKRGDLYLILTATSWRESDTISEEKETISLRIPSAQECYYGYGEMHHWRKVMMRQLHEKL